MEGANKVILDVIKVIFFPVLVLGFILFHTSLEDEGNTIIVSDIEEDVSPIIDAQVMDESVRALKSLGFSIQVAKERVLGILTEIPDASVETVIKMALKR